MTLVLFPSAKNVTKDLQGIGSMPAIIYPIDQMRMIDLFENYYFKETGVASAFEIVTYESHNQVAKRIGIKDKVRITKLDSLKDLGYTIWYGLKDYEFSSDDSVIINFADVVELGSIENPISDKCYYAKEDISSRWTYFKENAGVITDFYDKPSDIRGVDTNNMCMGIFHIAAPMDFRRILKESIEGTDDQESLWPALQQYSIDHPFEMVCTDEWFDIGHIDKYYDMQMAIKSRTFNHITIDKDRGILTKRSDDKEKFIGEIEWYLKLPTDVEYTRPRIFSYSTEYTNPSVSMEYYAYHTLHEIFLFGDLSDEQWCNVFRRIRFILNDFKRYSLKDEGIKDALKEMYLNKTLKRIKMMKNNADFPEFDHPITVNGIKYISLKEICGLLSELIDEWLMDVEEFHIIHGDLCFTNIMIDPNYSFIKLIDPRGKFGKYDIYGDRRYEFAKLMHSIDGKYDYIIKDKFAFAGDPNCFKYKIDYEENINIGKCFSKIFEDEMTKDGCAIKLIESLLFFSMIPLHKENYKQQLVMLGTAVSLLDQVTNIKCSVEREPI